MDTRDPTPSFMLLLSNVKSTSAGASAVRGSEVVKLDYYQTVAALTYLAEFHAAHWESKDEVRACVGGFHFVFPLTQRTFFVAGLDCVLAGGLWRRRVPPAGGGGR